MEVPGGEPVEVVAVNSGYSLSLIRDYIVELRQVRVAHEGNQFRSGDFFPQVVSDIHHGRHEERLLETLPVSQIPQFPASTVMWVDGFGNIKTSNRRSDSLAKDGRKVHIPMNDRRAPALVTVTNFSVDELGVSKALAAYLMSFVVSKATQNMGVSMGKIGRLTSCMYSQARSSS